MNDLIHLAMRRAVASFGAHGDGIFNSAQFSLALMRLAQLKGTIDGNLVEVILYGRDDVVQLAGGAHWALKENAP